jgi:hypothetical protein
VYGFFDPAFHFDGGGGDRRKAPDDLNWAVESVAVK